MGETVCESSSRSTSLPMLNIVSLLNFSPSGRRCGGETLSSLNLLEFMYL